MTAQAYREALAMRLSVCVLAGVLLSIPWPSQGAVTVTVDGGVKYQTIEGFGGSDGWLFAPPSEHARIFDDLGLSILRFRMLRYTEATPDKPGNEAADNDNDDPFVIDWNGVNKWALDAYAPYLKAAKRRGTKVIGTIWCPPAWMVSGNLAETPDNSFRDAYEDELVEFILIWVEGMQRCHDVHIDSVSIQNEPNYGNTRWPTCRYSPAKLRDIIKLLGARFETEEVTTKIHSPDVNSLNGFATYADTICKDLVASRYVDRLATHSYGEKFWDPDSAISKWARARTLADKYGKPLWETEYCNDGGNMGTWAEAPVLAQHLHNALVHGHVPAWLTYEIYRNPGASAAALITEDGPTPKFYAMKQYFRYVRPGAVRVGAACDDADLLVTAFVHEAQSTVAVVMINRDTAAKTVNCSLRNVPRQITTFSQYRTSSTENCVDVGAVTVSQGRFSVTIPADSITTFAGRLGP
jgi:glucuronoarabinoxylan endo-1,4-beta-xylanase